MQFDAHCIDCLVHRHFKLALEQKDGIKADAYLRDVMQIILDAPKGVSAPGLPAHSQRPTPNTGRAKTPMPD